MKAQLLGLLWLTLLAGLFIFYSPSFNFDPRSEKFTGRVDRDEIQKESTIEEMTQPKHQQEQKAEKKEETTEYLLVESPTNDMYSTSHDIISTPCPKEGSDLNLTIFIMSAPGHTEERNAIRKTWGYSENLPEDIRLYFVLGWSRNNASPQVQENSNVTVRTKDPIFLESEQYGDIIQGRFIDDYNNLTLKALSILEWFNNYCHKARFLLKTDDDSYINIPLLLTFLQTHREDKNTMFGRLAKRWKPCRDLKVKWCVTKEEYSGRIYPNFVTGPAYVLTNDITEKLYNTALNTTFFKLEDVFLTGIVANQLGISLINVKLFHNDWISLTTCHVRSYISIHRVKAKQQYEIEKKKAIKGVKC